MFSKKNIIIMLIAIGGLLIFIFGLFLWQRTKNIPPAETNVGQEETAAPSNEAKKNTQKLIDEVKKSAENSEAGSISKVINIQKTNPDGSITEEAAVVVAPYSNPISVESGEVLTRDGNEEAKSDSRAGNPDAPIQSDSVNPEQLPPSAIKLQISSNAIVPAEFKVKAGQAVALAMTETAGAMESVHFSDPALAAVVMGLAPGETRVITFNAPSKKGQYEMYVDFFGKKNIAGKMIVE